MMESARATCSIQGRTGNSPRNGPPFVLDLTHIDRDILHHLQYDSMPGDKETWNDYCAQAGIDFSAKPYGSGTVRAVHQRILYLKDNFKTRPVKGLFGGSVFNDFSGSICSGYRRRGSCGAGRRFDVYGTSRTRRGRTRTRATRLRSLWVSRTASAKTSSKPPSGRVMDYYRATSATRRGCPPPLKSSRSSSPWKTRSWQKKPARLFARARGHAPSADVPAHHADHAGTPGDRRSVYRRTDYPDMDPSLNKLLVLEKDAYGPRLSGPGPASLTGNPPGSAPAPGAARFPPQRGHQRLQRRQNPSFETKESGMPPVFSRETPPRFRTGRQPRRTGPDVPL